MRNVFCRRLKIYRSGVIVFLVSIISFTACENFFNGAQLREEIEEAVYIANHDSPVAKIEEPVFSDQGVSKNRAIIISFTMPMDPATFMDSLSITDSQGNSLMQHFINPQWSNDNKLVTVPAKELNLIDLHGQKAMDIYVTITKSCKTLDKIPIKDEIGHKYRICDSVDNVAPELIAVRGEFTPKHIWRDGDGKPILAEGATVILASGQTKELAAGEFTSGDENFIKQNHISNRADFYIEGNDYGGGAVFAHFKSTRVYDSSGNRVYESDYDSYERIPGVDSNGNSTGTVSLDLSDSKLMDGMYKVTVTTADASMLDSNESCVYYLVRDTALSNSANSLIWFENPQFRNDFTPDPNFYIHEFDLQTPTIGSIKYFMNRIQFAYLSNDVFYLDGNGVEQARDFSYYISWGTDLSNMVRPQPLDAQKSDDVDSDAPAITVGDSSWLGIEERTIYKLPAEYREYQNQHSDKDIYVQTIIYDSVGNSNVLTTLIPGQVEFFNYRVTPGSTADKKKITLNYRNLSGLHKELTQISSVPGKSNYALYRIFYGKIEEGISESDIVLKRNTLKTFNEDRSSDITDKNELEVEAGSKYIFYIQPNYNMNSLTNNRWCGQTFGVPYKLIVDTESATSSGSLTKPNFTYTKVSAGVNTSLFNINVTVTNPQPGVKYVPCFYSTEYIDDKGLQRNGWTYFDTHSEPSFTFQVKNMLKAPFDTAWKDRDEWKHYDDSNSYFESVRICREKYHYPDITTKVKILAIDDSGATAESDEQTLYFTEADDNIPPCQSSELISHDSWLDFDGHSFKFENLARENEEHLSPYFQYYYMPYDSTWGDNLSVASPSQIEGLPGGTGSYTSTCWKNDWDQNRLGEAEYSLNMNIPLNGIADGKYMLFARLSDTYGNYNYVTLGKASVGTFRNKLKVNWRTVRVDGSDKVQLVSTLPIETWERFDMSMINIQNLDSSDGTWWAKYGYYNELQNCTESTEDGKTVLRYETPVAPSDEIVNWNDSANGWVRKSASEIELGRWWYRITMQGFNENILTNLKGEDGVNWIYRRPYSDNRDTKPAIDSWVNNVSKYDLCTEETVSNTVYIFIPATDTYLDDIKSSFFPSTATPRSNKPFLVNVISSGRDLGTDPDEWERRGKLIYTHCYDPSDTGHYTQFNESVAADDMFNSNEKGFLYYVAVVHFADGKMAISRTYTMQGM
ncbi:MAG: hypothetical protein IKP60_00900 [Treponema sp.]|nr:hypothetical protein [Treponema sp.]